MKKTAVFFLFIFLISSFVVKMAFSAGPTKVVAANYSDRYHLPSCKIAQKIAPEDLLTFNSPEEAAAKGYVPCKKCNPPAPKGMTVEKNNFSPMSKRRQDDQNS